MAPPIPEALPQLEPVVVTTPFESACKQPLPPTKVKLEVVAYVDRTDDAFTNPDVQRL